MSQKSQGPFWSPQTPFNLHTHPPRPPQAPAASFQAPYRKCLGPSSSCPPQRLFAWFEAFPIEASDYTAEVTTNISEATATDWDYFRAPTDLDLRCGRPYSGRTNALGFDADVGLSAEFPDVPSHGHDRSVNCVRQNSRQKRPISISPACTGYKVGEQSAHVHSPRMPP
jgi:hypothetical protein